MQRLTKLLRHEGGGTAIEYALVASLIAMAALGAMQNLGGGVRSMFNNVQSEL